MKIKNLILITMTACCLNLCAADCHHIVPFILKWEGGYARLPNDPGGETNKGVTWGTWQKFYGRTHERFMRMDTADWQLIFKRGYWDKIHGDEISSQRVADVIAEWVWLSGENIPVKNVQRLLGLPADGMIGPATIRAINAADSQQLYEQLLAARYRFIGHIPFYNSTNWPFLDGWLNRLSAFLFFEQGSN